jgi:hypothetical protein
MDPDQSEEEVSRWVDRFRAFVTETTAKRLREAVRPDRRNGGRFLVQNASACSPAPDLSGIEPNWLRDRLTARAKR